MKNKTKLIQIALLLASTLAGSYNIINQSTTLATEITDNQRTANLFSQEEQAEIEKIKTAYLDNLSTKNLQQKLQTRPNNQTPDKNYIENQKLLVEQLIAAQKQHPQVVDIFLMMNALEICTPGVWFLSDERTDPQGMTYTILDEIQYHIMNQYKELELNEPEIEETTNQEHKESENLDLSPLFNENPTNKTEPEEQTDPDLTESTTIDISALHKGTKLLEYRISNCYDDETQNPKEIIEIITHPDHIYSSPSIVLGYTRDLADKYLPQITNMQTPKEPIDLHKLDDLQLINRNLEIIKQITQEEIDDGTYKTLTPTDTNKSANYQIIKEKIQDRITYLDKMIISLDNYIKTARGSNTAITIANIKSTNEKLSIILKALLP